MIDHDRLGDLLALTDTELEAYRWGYNEAMAVSGTTLEHLERLERRYGWLVFMWFVLGSMTGYLIGATFG